MVEDIIGFSLNHPSPVYSVKLRQLGTLFQGHDASPEPLCRSPHDSLTPLPPQSWHYTKAARFSRSPYSANSSISHGSRRGTAPTFIVPGRLPPGGFARETERDQERPMIHLPMPNRLPLLPLLQCHCRILVADMAVMMPHSASETAAGAPEHQALY